MMTMVMETTARHTSSTSTDVEAKTSKELYEQRLQQRRRRQRDDVDDATRHQVDDRRWQDDRRLKSSTSTTSSAASESTTTATASSTFSWTSFIPTTTLSSTAAKKHTTTKDQRRRPAVHDGTQHGMMIDAGSQGTRIHVYEYKARILSHKYEINDVVTGRKLSIPTTDTRWTNRLKPGLDSFAYIQTMDEMIHRVSLYLQPLIAFAQDVLLDKQAHWSHYPIYLKATGGLRTLPRPYRVRLIQAVRHIMSTATFNPFYFTDEHARVISGEEEAIYAWTAVNFVKGSLIANSEGLGTVVDANQTYGVIEMGGASAQIGFYEPNGDVMANLFKLQLGAAKHWNVYTHSFLYFGVNGAYARHNAYLVYAATTKTSNNNNDTNHAGTDRRTLDVANNDSDEKSTESTTPSGSIYNPCLPGGSTYQFTSRVQFEPDGRGLLPLSSAQDPMVLEADLYSAVMANPNTRGDFDACYDLTLQLLRKEANVWCDFAHDRDCALAGVYQPPLPVHDNEFGEFIATANFYDVWEFLQLHPRSSLVQLKTAAQRICTMHIKELQRHNHQLLNPITDINELSAMCFRATFMTNFLINGVGFPPDYEVTALDVVHGQKLGWALGSMLYEINTLPWEFQKHYLHKLLSLDILWGRRSDESVFETSIPGFRYEMVVVLGMVLLVVGVFFGTRRKRATVVALPPVLSLQQQPFEYRCLTHDTPTREDYGTCG